MNRSTTAKSSSLSGRPIETALREEEKRLRRALARRAEDATLFPLARNLDFRELERISRLRVLTTEHSFLRSNGWLLLAIAACSLAIVVLLLIHPNAGQISMVATSSTILVETTSKTELGELTDLFPDFRVAAVHGATAIRDVLDRELGSPADEKSVSIDPPGRLARLSAPEGATLIIDECGSASCNLTLTGGSVEALVSVTEATVCVSSPQNPCGSTTLPATRAPKGNLHIRSGQRLSFELVRPTTPLVEKNDLALPLLIADGPLGRISFDRTQGREGLPTGRLNTLSKGSVAFHDFGQNATIALLHRPVSIVSPSGIAEFSLRGGAIETSFVGKAKDVRSAGFSGENKTGVPSALEWLVGNKMIALLGVAITSGVGFVLAVIRRATGREMV